MPNDDLIKVARQLFGIPIKNQTNIMSRGITFIDDKHYEFGNVKETCNCIYILENGNIYPAPIELKNNPNVFYSVREGYYMLKFGKKPGEILANMYEFAPHLYPYRKITREYGAFHNMDFVSQEFGKAVKNLTIPKYTLSKYMPFTFGLEFETSLGAIPEDECLSKGLIPLRDGSITGVEYSTVVLKKDLGLYSIKQAIDALNRYTKFNKECALHIHMGGVPVEPKVILNINNICSFLANGDLNPILPSATFHSGRYKNNGKDYCNVNPYFTSFNELYQHFVGVNYFGDLNQPHPADPEKTGKWNIHSRYKMCNLVNMLCYDSPKTVEFRFLRPTKNVDLIYLWMYIFNAIIQVAIKHKDDPTMDWLRDLTLHNLLKEVYPESILTPLWYSILLLRSIRYAQQMNGDNCGAMIEFEEPFVLPDSLIYE